VIAGVVLAALAIGWVGWQVHAATHPAKDVRIKRTFIGTISLLNAAGDAGCVAPRGGGRQVCSAFYVDPAHPLHEGELVRVALEQAWVGDTGAELLLVYWPSHD
jgi:hypothetical protein